MSRNKDEKGLAETIKSQRCHSSSNRYPRASTTSARIKLCDYRQQEGHSAQDCVKELKAIHDVAKAIDGGQGVGMDREAFEEIEKTFQIQHGCTPSGPSLLERRDAELADYSNMIVLAHISLRGALPSKHRLLKVEL